MSADPVPPFALVRRPAAALASGCVSFIERQPVVILDDESVLMSAHAPRTARLLRDRGLTVITVITVDISEFEKLAGCVTCLSVRARG